MKKFIMIIIVLITLIGCSKPKETTNELESDAILFKKEYESLNGEKNNNDSYYRILEIAEDNPFIYKEASDIIEMINNQETFVVYFGYASCPWCRSIITNLIAVSNDLEISTIYYVDLKNIRDTLEIDDTGNIITTKEGTTAYYELVDKLASILEDYTLTDKDGNEINTNKKRIYAPNIITVVDGIPTNMTTGISNLQENAYMELTDEIKADSYNKIKCTIECIVEEKAICTLDKKC